MLSAAKHLLFLNENKQKQILRCAQDDIVGGFCSIYDSYGNMACTQNAQTNGPCPQWTFNTATNQITNSGFSYDASGDLTGDGTHTYQWNAEGRLKSVDNGNTATYVYNALGWRVEKKVGSTYTEILYDQSGESLGENNRTTWTQSYVNFAGRHVAIYANNSTYFTHPNSLGSTVMVSDYTGAIVEDKLFYPWGQDWEAAGTLYEERFAKLQHRDSETALDPTPNRMFSSGEGRWLSPDPRHGNVWNPQSLDRYAYVENEPCSAIDPLGLGPGDDEGPPETVCEVGGNFYTGGLCDLATEPRGRLATFPGYHGGGGGRGGVGVPTDPATNKLARGILQGAFRAYPHCLQVFTSVLSQTFRNFSISAFEGDALVANYYRVSLPGPQGPVPTFFGDLTLYALTGTGTAGNSTAFSWLGHADAKPVNGPWASAVLLGTDFFTDPKLNQPATLLHEAIHLFTDWSDDQVLNAFKGSGLTNTGSGTEYINDWIARDCQPK